MGAVERIANLRRVHGEQVARRTLLRDQLVAAEAAVAQHEQAEADIAKAQALIQEAALETQAKLRVHLTAIATAALAAIFPDKGYEFDVQFETKRGRTECVLQLRQGDVTTDPMVAHGGGVVDVLSFALRASFWSISRTRPVLVLDEPMKFLSQDLREAAADMLRDVSTKLGVQVIMVTHIPEFADVADKLFEVAVRDGVSYVREV